jgi:hypothetical protein
MAVKTFIMMGGYDVRLPGTEYVDEDFMIRCSHKGLSVVYVSFSNIPVMPVSTDDNADCITNDSAAREYTVNMNTSRAGLALGQHVMPMIFALNPVIVKSPKED